MPLIIAGIDEAGYGPLLGPLCIGMVALRIDSWTPGEPPPDLWKVLSAAVCRKPQDKRRRIAFEDSKRLKLPNSVAEDSHGERHPVMHLERGILSLLGVLGARPATDLELFDLVGAEREPHAWYAGDPRPLPIAMSPDQVGITANTLARAMSRAGVGVLGMRCRTVCEGTFNEVVRREGSKAAATAIGVVGHLRWVWEQWGAEPVGPIENEPASGGGPAAASAVPGSGGGGPRVICDRLGGRTDYTEFLRAAIAGAEIETIEQSPRLSAYRLTAREAGPDRRPREMTVHFLPESESRHLPVAAASMLAKLTRELMMARFNAYWCAMRPELKPTAGYRQDGWRWLNEATEAGLVTAEARAAMIRTV